MTKKDYANPDNLQLEQRLWASGVERVVGIDECGRGPWAGPVVACAVLMPKDLRIDRLTDSKKIPKKEHVAFAEQVKASCIGYGIGVATVEEIDRHNIKEASRIAMTRALETLIDNVGDVSYVLVDGNEQVYLDIPQESVIKGDYMSHSISAAAILAKVYRDQEMAKLDEEFDGVYGWGANAGYQTQKHMDACREHGLTKHHRRSWKTTQLFEN